MIDNKTQITLVVFILTNQQNCLETGDNLTGKNNNNAITKKSISEDSYADTITCQRPHIIDKDYDINNPPKKLIENIFDCRQYKNLASNLEISDDKQNIYKQIALVNTQRNSCIEYHNAYQKIYEEPNQELESPDTEEIQTQKPLILFLKNNELGKICKYFVILDSNTLTMTDIRNSYLNKMEILLTFNEQGIKSMDHDKILDENIIVLAASSRQDYNYNHSKKMWILWVILASVFVSLLLLAFVLEKVLNKSKIKYINVKDSVLYGTFQDNTNRDTDPNKKSGEDMMANDVLGGHDFEEHGRVFQTPTDNNTLRPNLANQSNSNADVSLTNKEN